jgi:hypothetical protein
MMLATFACEDMNDKHRPWLENGEIIYIGKVDSLYAFPGDERIQFRYWISDPRAKTLTVSWSLGKESLEIEVPAHLPGEHFDVYIGKNERTIAEGDHTFQWTVWDDKGNRSVVLEKGANVYGPRYRSHLYNRALLGVEVDGTTVTMRWGGMTDDDETGVIISYTEESTETPVERYFTSAEIASPVVLSDVKLASPVTYRTLYLPDPAAIDTFSTDTVKAEIISTINVVRGKPVTHSDLTGSYTGQMAVDGVTTDPSMASRWVSAATDVEHWIEVDLQGTFAINVFRMWRDMSNTAQKMPKFSLQAWVNGGWVDIVSEENNEEAIYYKEFDYVTTDKVRLYVPAYADNRTRVFEIEVYSIIKY